MQGSFLISLIVIGMFEFDAFPGTPLKQQYLIPEIV